MNELTTYLNNKYVINSNTKLEEFQLNPLISFKDKRYAVRPNNLSININIPKNEAASD